MEIQELLEELFEQEFSQFESCHLIISLVIAVGIIGFQLIQTIYISRSIEKFKAQLKKAEIKFSHHAELQVTTLRSIYHSLVSLQSLNSSIFNYDPNSVSHSYLKNQINKWITKYLECVNEFSNEKMLLTTGIKELFSSAIVDMRAVKSLLIDVYYRLDELEMEYQGNWHAMYGDSDHESDRISRRIERLKESDCVTAMAIHFRELRKEIEGEFDKMT